MNIHVSALNFYPIKSSRGISVTSTEVGPLGIHYDRQWMFVNDQDVFVAQRGDRKIGTIGVRSLCLVEPSIVDNTLLLAAPDMPVLSLPVSGYDGTEHEVRVWDSFSKGIDQGDEAAVWATTYLSREVPGNYRLMRAPDDTTRSSKRGDGHLAFADGYPFLIVSEESLLDLNSRLDEPLPMNRFRPNIVLSGCEPYQEDTLPNFRINTVDFIGMKLCIRCPITTTNQLTTERGKEPLLTLSKYRKSEDGVVFARNFNHAGTGVISVGDKLVF